MYINFVDFSSAYCGTNHLQRASVQIYRASAIFSVSRAVFQHFYFDFSMVRTRGGSRLQPWVRFSSPEREAPAPVPAPVPSPVPEAVPKEPQRRVRRVRPSKRVRTSGLGESSSSRPPPSPVTSASEATSIPHLSPASRIRRPLFVGNPISGNVRLHRRPFHQESYYDVPALRADPRYRESMRLIEDYSLLPSMTPRQYYYPRVVV